MIIYVVKIGAAVLLMDMDGVPGEEPSPVNASFLKESGFRNGTVLVMAKGHFFVCLRENPLIKLLMNAFGITVNSKNVHVFVARVIALTLFTGTSGSDAISGSLSSICNVGPALGDLGTHGNFNSQNTVTKFIFTLDMFLGRLEIYPVLAVLSMIFSRKKN